MVNPPEPVGWWWHGIPGVAHLIIFKLVWMAADPDPLERVVLEINLLDFLEGRQPCFGMQGIDGLTGLEVCDIACRVEPEPIGRDDVPIDCS